MQLEGASRDEVVEEQMDKAVRKVLQCDDFSFKSKEQEEALRTILRSEQKTPLIIVLPTSGGKGLLFLAPACIDDPGVTIVVVPYRALINNLVATARTCAIDFSIVDFGLGVRSETVYYNPKNDTMQSNMIEINCTRA